MIIEIKLVVGSMEPVGLVSSDQSVWSIEYSQEVRRPTINAYIRFYSKSANTEVYKINVRTNLADVKYFQSNLIFSTWIRWTTVYYNFFKFRIMYYTYVF